jgi:aflatoxin B1 aldehyde reductase
MTSTAVASNGANAQVSIALGTMEFGRYATEADAQRMVELFLAAGHRQLDTALMYCGGETERIIGRLPPSVKSRVSIDTKANPWGTAPPLLGLSYSSVLEQLNRSLTSLAVTPDASSPPIDIFYLHAPDPSTPLIDTLRAVQELHAQGKFRRFGLSNFSSWQVMQIHGLCKENKYVLPAVYQGMSEAQQQRAEQKLAFAAALLTQQSSPAAEQVQRSHSRGGA